MVVDDFLGIGRAKEGDDRISLLLLDFLAEDDAEPFVGLGIKALGQGEDVDLLLQLGVQFPRQEPIGLGRDGEDDDFRLVKSLVQIVGEGDSLREQDIRIGTRIAMLSVEREIGLVEIVEDDLFHFPREDMAQSRSPGARSQEKNGNNWDC